MESRTLRLTAAIIIAPHCPAEAALVLGLLLTAFAIFHDYFKD